MELGGARDLKPSVVCGTDSVKLKLAGGSPMGVAAPTLGSDHVTGLGLEMQMCTQM